MAVSLSKRRMLLPVGCICAAAGFAVSSHGPIFAHGPARSVNDGVYDQAQAGRGRDAYRTHCAACHGASLTGEGAPALAGPFWSSWNRRSLDELYLLVQGSMPQQAPESLPAATYADILAYMLQAGGYPDGPHPLPADEAAMAAIRIEIRK